MWTRTILGVGAIAAIISAAVFSYLPGVAGPFLFDTMYHLPRLALFTEYPVWERMFLIASPGDGRSPWLTRPLSFLTFILNDPYWPVASPKVFKFTNILIHIVNAILLFWLLLKITAISLRSGMKDEISLIAIVVAGMAALLWAVHPMQVSTVLYVVQRMTELGALFSLIALLVFLFGRFYALERPVAGYLIMTGGLVFFGMLGFLCKQIVVMVLFYVLVIEFFLLRPSHVAVPKYYGLWLGSVIVLPIILLIGYLAFVNQTFRFAYEYRAFSSLERVLTEARILIDYLQSILAPRLHGSGLFHDDYPISTGLLNPPATLFSVIVVVALLALAFFVRRAHPVLAFGIVWFFSGHLLESVLLPLELYIEHRNYLPMIGPLYALVFYALTNNSKIKALTRLAVVPIAGFFLVLTFLNSAAWGQPRVLAEIWLKENPSSIRANGLSAKIAEHDGDYRLALDLIEHSIDNYPHELALLFARLRLQCRQGGVMAEDLEEVLRWMPHTRLDVILPHEVELLVDHVLSSGCYGIAEESLRDHIAAVLTHPQLQEPPYAKKVAMIGYNLAFMLSKVNTRLGDLNGAISALDRAFLFNPNASAPVTQAAMLLSAGLPEDAWEYLQKAKEANEPDPNRVLHTFEKFLPRMNDRNIEILEEAINIRSERHE